MDLLGLGMLFKKLLAVKAAIKWESLRTSGLQDRSEINLNFIDVILKFNQLL